jgi:hypothetical protein
MVHKSPLAEVKAVEAVVDILLRNDPACMAGGICIFHGEVSITIRTAMPLRFADWPKGKHGHNNAK